MKKSFALTKKVAKHGTQSIICIPKLLEEELPPGTVVSVNIEVLKEAET